MWVMRHLLQLSNLEEPLNNLNMACSASLFGNPAPTYSKKSSISPTKPPLRGWKSGIFGESHGKDSISLPSRQSWVSCQLLRAIVWSANPMVPSRTERKLSWRTVERAWLDFAPKRVAQERSPRSSPESLTWINRIGLIEMAVGSVYLGLVV